jgi:hypothetical protein
VKAIQKTFDRDDVNGHGNRQLDDDQRGRLEQQRLEALAAMRHDHEQRRKALEVVTLAEARARMFYGEQIKLDQPQNWQEVIDRRARVLSPRVMRSLVHA